MSQRESLVALVNNALSRNRNLTLHTIARKCEVGYSTLRRIMQADGEPSEATIVNLVINLLPPHEASEYFQKHFPSLAMGRMMGVYAKNKVAEMDSAALRNLNRDEFLVFVIVYGRGRIDREKLERYVGFRGPDAVTQLLKNGLVQEEFGEIIANEKDVFYTSVESTLGMIEHAVDLFPKNDPKATLGNSYWFKSQALNEDGVKLVTELLNDFLKRYDEIILDERFRGDKVTLFTLTQSVLGGELK